MTLTFDKSHLNWFAMKGLANEYHLANFHDYSDESVQENASFTDFPRPSFSACDLAWGHLTLHALKGLTTDYHCANFHACSDDSVWENDTNVWFFRNFLSALTTVTLDEGRRNGYNLKGIDTKYLCATFHDCTVNGDW